MGIHQERNANIKPFSEEVVLCVCMESTGGGSWASSSDSSSDELTLVTPSPDLEITATLIPGSTTSPSLATNYQQSNAEAKLKSES